MLPCIVINVTSIGIGAAVDHRGKPLSNGVKRTVRVVLDAARRGVRI